MREFTVHEPPAMAATREARAESLVFVKDGFSWGAFAFGPFYFLFKAEWLGLIAYLAAMIAVEVAAYLLGAGEAAKGAVLFALNVIAGFEANELKRFALERAGWREIAAVSGRDQDECERRFFDGWLPGEPMITPAVWQNPLPYAPDLTTRAEAALRTYAARLRANLAPKA